MELSLFEKVVREAGEIGVEYIHLQGWGEPLLHPQFLDILNFAKRYSAGFTTNAKYLTPVLSEKILKIGIDLLAVTFAGATAETHNRFRRGNDFNLVVNNLKKFVELAKSVAYKKPRIIAIYMMLKDTVQELPEFVRLAASIGVDEVRLSNVSYVPNPYVWGLKVFSEMFRPEPPDVVEAVDKAKEIANSLGLKLFHRRFSPWEYAECPEAPTSTLFINVEGYVSPCVFLNIPAPSPTRCFENKCEKAPRVIFGNVKYESLIEIIKKRQYKEFIKIFETRKREDFMPPDPPDVCKKCYRLYWV